MKDCATFLMYSIILWTSSLCDIKGISYVSYIKEKAIPPLNRTRTRHKSCKLFFPSFHFPFHTYFASSI